MHYLCKYSLNWADEADFEGFELIGEEEHQLRINMSNLMDKYKVDPEIYMSFGSNEGEDYLLSEILDCGEPISDEIYDSISRLLGNRYGWTPYNLKWMLEDYIDDNYIDAEDLTEHELNYNRFLKELSELLGIK